METKFLLTKIGRYGDKLPDGCTTNSLAEIFIQICSTRGEAHEAIALQSELTIGDSEFLGFKITEIITIK